MFLLKFPNDLRPKILGMDGSGTSGSHMMLNPSLYKSVSVSSQLYWYQAHFIRNRACFELPYIFIRFFLRQSGGHNHAFALHKLRKNHCNTALRLHNGPHPHYLHCKCLIWQILLRYLFFFLLLFVIRSVRANFDCRWRLFSSGSPHEPILKQATSYINVYVILQLQLYLGSDAIWLPNTQSYLYISIYGYDSSCSL